jgi:hypothetical protein
MIERILKELGFDSVRLYDKRCRHYIAVINGYRYYIIFTNSVLKNSKSVFGVDYGEMLGVRSSILTQDIDFIVWIVSDSSCVEAYIARAYQVNAFCLENRTVYRNKVTGEYICNYPVSLARKVYEKCTKTLLSYGGGSR